MMRLYYQLMIVLVMTSMSLSAQNTPKTEMEKLSRGVVALPSRSKGCFISWRLLGTDDERVKFNLLRNGKIIASNLSDATDYNDDNGDSTCSYQVETVSDGKVVSASEPVKPWRDIYMKLKLDRPAADVTAAGEHYSYCPNDCSVGDVDGDGEYEIIMMWAPTNCRDNSFAGFTGKEFIDCYKLNGKKLWRVDLGPNIRAGAHYTQFLVYDFDGDGKAEMICKTAPGTKDGVGLFVNQVSDENEIKSQDNNQNCLNEFGHVVHGPEYLTVFNGLTGAAVHTVYYRPNRSGGDGVAEYPADKNFWGDAKANRSERYLACVANLDGPDRHPSAVMCRGYYTRSYLWAVDFDGKRLSTKWLHASLTPTMVVVTDSNGNSRTKCYDKNTSGTEGSFTVFGQGTHSLCVGDVDDDGCDEITYGSAAIDNNGDLLYSTGLGHGDAIHLGDMDPDRKGLEVYMVHEKTSGCDLRDAKTGELLLRLLGSGDTGRGMAADIDAAHRGYEIWNSDASKENMGVKDIKGHTISTARPSYDFRVYWDGDLQDELLSRMKGDKPFMEKWDGEMAVKMNGIQISEVNSSFSCNGTKGTPNISADLFGDWREEMIYWCGTDSATLNIFTTNIPTPYRVPTLMHDHIYRMGVATQNVCYNQPPHLGYFLPDSRYVMGKNKKKNKR